MLSFLIQTSKSKTLRSFLRMIAILGVFFLLSGCSSAKYEKVYKEVKFDLISAGHDVQINGRISESINLNSFRVFFISTTKLSNNTNGEIKQTDVYKFYYIANPKTGKVMFKTLNAKKTPLFFIADGETPYLLRKKWQTYLVEGEKRTKYGKPTVKNELHIPKEAILKVFDFSTK